MKTWVYFYLIFFLDVTFRNVCNFGIWCPDLLIISLIYITMTRPLGEAYLYGFVTGLMVDLIYMDLLGMHAFLYVIAAMSVAPLRQLLWGQYATTRLLLGFVYSTAIRFGEVIFWLSSLNKDIPLQLPKWYIAAGGLMTGVTFFLIPWKIKIHTHLKKPKINVGKAFPERF